MGLLLVYAVIIVAGGVLVAGPLLARPLVARGRRVYAILLLLPLLAAFGGGVGLAVGIFLSIFLFGFDIAGKAPWWDRYLPAVGAMTGSLIGSAIALLICYRSGPSAGRDFPDLAADYDEGHRLPTEAENPTDAGR